MKLLTLLIFCSQHLPDIDPNVGLPVPTIKGDIRMEKVEFTYQMRPEEKVFLSKSILNSILSTRSIFFA